MPELHQPARNQHECQATRNCGHPERLEDRDPRLVQPFNGNPRRAQPHQGDGEHCYQANAGRGPPPERQSRQHKVSAQASHCGMRQRCGNMC